MDLRSSTTRGVLYVLLALLVSGSFTWASGALKFVAVLPNSVFTPRSDPQLQVWFTGSDDSSITQASGLVSQWNDKSANAYNATEATGSLQPAYASADLNGHATISFDGTKALPFPTNALISTSSQFGIYVVLKHTTINGGGFNIFFGVSDGAAHPPYLNYNGTTGKYQFVGPSGTWQSVEATASPGTSNYHLLEILYNGSGATTAGNFSIYFDKSLLTTSSLATSDYADPNVLGTYARVGGVAGNSLKGNVAEVIVTRSTSTRQDIETYVTRTWGL